MRRAEGGLWAWRRRALAAWLATSLCTGLALPAAATEAALASADPALDARVMSISAELRCLVCQNQTIADSHAELAVDLRNQVREMLQKGRSDTEILAYMTDRYGDFVLYRPPLKATTALLWFGPGVLLVGGLILLGLILRRRNRMSGELFDADLNDDAGDDVSTPAASPSPSAPTPRPE